MSPSGSAGKTLSRRVTGISVFTAKGRAGSNMRNTAESAFVAAGGKQGTWNRTGTAISTRTGSAAGQWEIIRQGASVRGYLGTGSRAITYAETGAGVAVMSASGSDFSSGTGVAQFAGTGASAVVYTETGTASSPLSARGFVWPRGSGVMVLSAAGNLKQLYGNDMFANREPIDPPTGDLDMDEGERTYELAGATDRATNETGERLGVGTNFAISNTLWWELVVPFRCIVRLDAIAHNQAQTWKSTGYANRGSAVNALSSYGDPSKHFGQDSGRGLDSTQTASTQWGAFPTTVGGVRPLYVQTDPATPLLLNVGKNTTIAPLNQQVAYTLHVDRLLPPLNDDLSSAEVVEGVSGSIQFDMIAATGDPGWDWTQLDLLRYFPDSYRMSGDIFYRFDVAADGALRVRLNQMVASDSLLDVHIHVFDGDSFETWTPVPLGVFSSYPYAYQGPSASSDTGFADFPVVAGHTYTVAVLQMRGMSFSGGSMLSSQVTTRRQGVLEWELVTAPANDHLANRVNLGSASSGSTSVADSRGSTFEIGEPAFPYYATSKSIWYQFSPPTSGWYQFDWGDYPTWPISFSIYLQSFRGSTYGSLELVSLNSAQDRLHLRGGETYVIRLIPTNNAGFNHQSMSWYLEYATVAPNDDFANRIAISSASGATTYNPVGATNEAGEPPSYFYDVQALPSLWYGFTPPSTGTYVFRAESDGDPNQANIAVYTGSLGSLTPVAKMFAYDVTEVGFDAQAGTEYKIQVGARLAPHLLVPLRLEWEPHTKVTNTSFSAAEQITGATGSVFRDNFAAPGVSEPGTPTLDDLLSDDFVQGRAVWFRFTPASTGEYTFTITGSEWEGAIGIFEGATLASLQPVPLSLQFFDYAVDYVGPFQSDIFDVPLESGVTYHILVTGISYLSTWDQGLWDATQVSQGRFTLSWVSSVPNDDLDQAALEGSNLNVVLIPTDDGSPYYHDEIFLAGNCKIGSTTNATAQPGEPPAVPGFGPIRTSWFRFMPTIPGTYEFWVEGHGPDPVLDPMLAVYRLIGSYSFSNLTLVTSSDDADGLYPRATATLVSSATYVIQVDGRDEGDFKIGARFLPVASPPANDNFANAAPLVSGSPISGTTVGARTECGELASLYANSWGPWGSVWYTLTAAETTSGIISFDGTTTEHDIVSVYRGTSLADLVLVAEDYDFGSGIFVQFPMIQGETYRVRVMTFGTDSGSAQAPFTIELLQQSTTPPGNDLPGNATPITPGDNPGSTDGSTVDPGEVDPLGGTLTGGGTVWHKYVAPAPGFIDLWVSRTAPKEHWYRLGVWEGAAAQSGTVVRPFEEVPAGYNNSWGALASHYEVRQGQTYWIQVIRDADQTWGSYTLHLNEYLETKDWDFATDGFTSTTNSPTLSGGQMTCTGSQAIADVLDVLPNYGTVDLGANTPKWGRETRIYFEVRIIGGQVLHRAMSYGGDDWTFANAASDDHVNITTRRVGLLRARDTDGVHRLAVSLAPNNKGENLIVFQTATGSMTAPVSLGGVGPQHDTGWVGIEIELVAANSQKYDGASGSTPTAPEWALNAFVDGRPVDPGGVLPDGGPTYVGKQLRYLDFGMYRHPSMGPVTDTLVRDQRYVENNEAWTYQMRAMRVTNVVPQDPPDLQAVGDSGVFEFDGFASGVPWQAEGNHHKYSVSPTGDLPIVAAPGKPGWGAFRSWSPSGTVSRVSYAMQTGSRRVYALSLRADTFPATKVALAGYNASALLANTGSGMGILLLDATGELRIRPYGTRDFCVAHLTTGSWYWIEVHVDAEVMWDVRCTVYINGVLFGTFSNSYSWSLVGTLSANSVDKGALPAGHQGEYHITYGTVSTTAHNLYYTNLVSARGAPGEIGPLQTVRVGAVADELGHYLPDAPGEFMSLQSSDGGSHAKIYNWSDELEVAGPITVTWPAGVTGSWRTFPFGAGLPRYWEPYFVLPPTRPWKEESFGVNAWSPLGRLRVGDGLDVSAVSSPSEDTAMLKLTNFGNSVPVDAIVSGIEVRVGRKATGTINDLEIKLVKDGTVVGTNMSQGPTVQWSTAWEIAVYGGESEMWGTSWSPQEINREGFGVAITAEGSGTARIDQVTVRVYFADEGGPSGVNRGPLGAAGLYNFVGDQLVCEFLVTGSAGTASAAGFWSGGEPGGTRGGKDGTLSGTPLQKWGTAYPLWFWQARGVKEPSFDWSGGSPGNQATLTGFRLVRNPLVYPRFAWSANDGATWTWIEQGEGASAAHVGADVGATPAGDALFLDNCAALDRWEINNGSWSSGLWQDRPTAATSYRFPYWYLAYTGAPTSQTDIRAANLWARWRPVSGYPKVAASTSATFRAYIADEDGSSRRVGSFTGGGTFADPSIARFTVARAPDGQAWGQAGFNAMQFRIGYNNDVSTGAFSWKNDQSGGAAVYALTWELLVPATPDPPPAPCESPKYLTTIVRKR